MDARTPVAPHRFLRALGLTVAALAVGAAAHLLGGAPVAPLPLAVAFPVLLGLAWPLTGRERGWLPIAAPPTSRCRADPGCGSSSSGAAPLFASEE